MEAEEKAADTVQCAKLQDVSQGDTGGRGAEGEDGLAPAGALHPAPLAFACLPFPLHARLSERDTVQGGLVLCKTLCIPVMGGPMETPGRPDSPEAQSF